MSRSLLALLLPLALVGCQPKVDDEGDDTAEADADTDTDADADADADADTDTDTDVSGTLIINELMPSNTATITDEGGAYPDWVELYNPGDAAVSLAGWTITDDLEAPDKFELDGSLSVPAGGFLLLWADDDEDEGVQHLGFNLDAAGEDLGIFDPDGRPSDQISFGAMAADLSAARVPDGSSNWEITSDSTPGSSNGSGR